MYYLRSCEVEGLRFTHFASSLDTLAGFYSEKGEEKVQRSAT